MITNLKTKTYLKLLLFIVSFATLLSFGCGTATSSESPTLSSTISYELQEKKTIIITLYDVFGNQAYSKQETETKTGTNTITLSSLDITSTSTSNSIYFYIIKDLNEIVIQQGKTVFN